MSLLAPKSVVVQFPAPVRPAANRFSMRDRIEALRWAEAARASGYTRVVLDTCAEALEPDLGDFMLVYRRDSNWASWGVGCVAEGFMLWSPATGVTVGGFSTLAAALEKILALSCPPST
jgi:hypothetical protein